MTLCSIMEAESLWVLWNQVLIRGIKNYTTVGAGESTELYYLCICLESLKVSRIAIQEDILDVTLGRGEKLEPERTS